MRLTLKILLPYPSFIIKKDLSSEITALLEIIPLIVPGYTFLEIKYILKPSLILLTPNYILASRKYLKLFPINSLFAYYLNS